MNEVGRLRAFRSFALAAALSLGALGVSAFRYGRSSEFLLFGAKISGYFSAFWLVFALVPWLFVIQKRTMSPLSIGTQRVSLGLRIALVVVLGIAFSHPKLERHSNELCVVLYLDESESIAPEEEARKRELVALVKRGEGDHHKLSVVEFAKQSQFSKPEAVDAKKSLRGLATNLERALILGSAGKLRNCGLREVIVTDGRETEGRALRELLRHSRQGADLKIIPLKSGVLDDLAVKRIQVPARVVSGEPFTAEVQVSSPRPLSARIELKDDTGQLLSPAVELSNFEGERVIPFKITTYRRGPLKLVAHGVRSSPDQFEENNSASRALWVEGPPKVLLVDGVPSEAAPLRSALSAQGFDVETRSAAGFPASDQELANFDIVTLSDVPKKLLSEKSETRLASFVAAGKSLFFVGGAGSFGPGGWENSTLEKILPLRVSESAERETPGVALALVIDRSGSMAGLPLEMAKQACDESARVLSDSDLVTVIAFDSRPMRAVPLTSARSKERIFRDIMRIKPGGGTEIFGALDAAYQDLSAAEARRKHIVLLTDGVSGSDGLTDLARTAFGGGITVTTVGFGPGVNEDLLQAIANAGGGRFHRAEDALHLPRIFTKETESLMGEREEEREYRIAVSNRPRFLRGVAIEGAPPLFGRNNVELAPAAELYLTLNDGTPLLAERAHGQGHVLAWSSDLKASYARRFLGFRDFPKFLAQMLRSHEVASEKEELAPVELSADDEQLNVRFDASQLTGALDTTSISTLRVLDSGSGKELAKSALTLSAPALYEATVKRPHMGNLRVELTHEIEVEGKSLHFASRSEASEVPPRELSIEPNESPNLDEWAQSLHAEKSPNPARLWDAHPRPPLLREALRPQLLLLALLLFLADLALRRLAPSRSLAPLWESGGGHL